MREDPARTEIVHNLRTAVIDGQGRLVTVLRGNEWKADQLVDELRAANGRR
jgi:cytochrome oxidase Cu insertion factor (SCO1/SenC/PrrC family)